MRTVLAAAVGIACAVVDIGPSGRVMAQPGAAGSARDEIATAAAAEAAEARRGDPVVLVVLDGVRWQEIFEGVDPVLARGTPLEPRGAAALTPNLHALMREHGASLGGTDRGRIRASGPNFVSLPSYREIFSGRALEDCTSNECSAIARPTLVDELRDRGRKVAVFSSWEKIELAAAKHLDGVVMSAGRGEDPGDPWPGSGAFRQDRATADAALLHLQAEQPDFLFVGLGEPDEYAHRGDYAGYVRSLVAADSIVGEIRTRLDRMGERGRRTHLFVTADHGRSEGFREHGGRYPESARVWLVASGPRIVARGDVKAEGDRRLRDVAPTIRLVAGLPAGERSADAGRPIATFFAR